MKYEYCVVGKKVRCVYKGTPKFHGINGIITYVNRHPGSGVFIHYEVADRNGEKIGFGGWTELSSFECYDWPDDEVIIPGLVVPTPTQGANGANGFIEIARIQEPPEKKPCPKCYYGIDSHTCGK